MEQATPLVRPEIPRLGVLRIKKHVEADLQKKVENAKMVRVHGDPGTSFITDLPPEAQLPP